VALLTSGMAFGADDVDEAVWWAVDKFSAYADRDWDVPAGSLTWSCWETIEHVADDLLFYAGQLVPRKPLRDRAMHFGWAPKREGGPHNIAWADRAGGVPGLLEVTEICGGFLGSVVRTVSPDVVAYHRFGRTGGEGFAAMGVVEVLAHSFDVAQGLGVAWEPPGGLTARVLARLFPHVESSGDAAATLLWATGRGELPGRDRLGADEWEWVNQSNPG